MWLCKMPTLTKVAFLQATFVETSAKPEAVRKRLLLVLRNLLIREHRVQSVPKCSHPCSLSNVSDINNSVEFFNLIVSNCLVCLSRNSASDYEVENGVKMATYEYSDLHTCFRHNLCSKWELLASVLFAPKRDTFETLKLKIATY